MKDIDLNINNYNQNDIMKILDIPDDYTIDLVNKCYKDKFDECKKRNANEEILQFLLNIKNKFIYGIKSKKLTNQTSVINAENHYVMEKNTTVVDNLIDRNYRLNPIETYQTTIARSNLNNLKRKTQIVTLVFNTKFIHQSEIRNNNEYTFMLPDTFKNVFSMKLSSLQLPNSVYAFTCQNNFFYIKENTTDKQGMITIGEGNYTSDEFPDYLTELINATLDTDDRFEVKISNHTGKLSIINVTNTFSVIFNIESYGNVNSCVFEELCCQRENNREDCEHPKKHLDFYVNKKNNKNNVGALLGFKKSIYKDLNSITGETIFNITPFNYLYFCLDDYNKSQYNSIIGILSESLINNNILAMVPITANFFNYNFDNTSDQIEKIREYFGPINLVKITVTLLNEKGDIIDLNGQHFSFSIELETGYDW